MIVVLVQNPKGGGLGAGFGGGGSANMMGGVKQTTDFLEKATWYLVTALFVLSIVSSALISSGDNNGSGNDTEIEQLIDE